MQPHSATAYEKEPVGARTLWEMYDSEQLLNEGIVSFEYPLYYATDEEMDYFLGKLVKRVSRAASGVVKAAGSVAKGVGQGVNAVTKFVPLSTLTSALAQTPMGFAVRAGLGAVKAAASGRNVFQGAMRSIATTPLTRFAVDTAAGVARGENILKAAQRAGQAGIGDVRESLRFAAMVAPFVPGIGTGAAAALAAANALASGERISDALIAAARNAVPGGALAQTAFDMAANLAKGKKLSQAVMDAARSRLPGGPAAQAAFDSGLALAKGKSLQDSLIAGGGRLLPKSPYAADVLSFVKKAAAGENLGKAALSSAGNLVMKRIEQQAGPIISKTVGRLPIPTQPVRQRLRGIPSFGREVSELAPVSANSTGVGTRRGSNVIVSAAGYAPQIESFEYDFEVESSEATTAPLRDLSFLKALIAVRQRDPNKLTDAVFYRRHPELRGKRIGNEQTALKNEWLFILHSLVQPLLGTRNASTIAGGSASADVAAAHAIARKAVPGIPGVTIEQLIAKWRPHIAPEIPMPVLLGFMRFESGGNFNDATHGSPKNHPPYTHPAFYELGLFQTPAGLHGKCTSGDPRSCANGPPGTEIPGDPSTWARLCKKIGANPQDWTNPTTQVRVGLLDLKNSANTIRGAYPELFPTLGSDWYLRAAVLLPFARGGGFTRAFLNAFRKDLAKLREEDRWTFLRGKQVPVRGGTWLFDPTNVDKKMSLAAKLR